MNELSVAIQRVVKGREDAYCSVEALMPEMLKLIKYAMYNRDDRAVNSDEKEASVLVVNALTSLGFEADMNIGRDLWELVSEDSQAQWLYPPEEVEGVIISLVNVSDNMARSQCNIAFH
jgi:hypothetical protein